jgi:hypothetical protein
MEPYMKLNPIGWLRERRPEPLLIVALLISVFAYSNIFKGQFVWDDVDFIVNWQEIRNLPENLPGLLKGDLPEIHKGAYRPLRSIYYALAYSWFGLNPTGYHVLGLLAHLAGVIFVYLIGWEITRNKKAAGVAAAIFAVHPALVESVSWITPSFDNIGVVLGLGSVYGFFRFRRSKDVKWKWMYIALALLAFFSNEITLTLPVLLTLSDWLMNTINPDKKKTVKATFRFKGWRQSLINQVLAIKEVWLLDIVFWAIKFGVFNANQVHRYMFGSLEKTLWLMVKVMVMYLKMAVWPDPLTVNHLIRPGVSAFYYHDYNYANLPKAPGFADIDMLAALLILVVTGVVCFKFRKKQPLWWWVFGWLVICLMPVMQIFPRSTIFAERYLYIPLVGLSIVAGSLLAKLVKKYKAAGWAAVAIIVVVFAARTYIRNFDWKSNSALWRSTIAVGPESSTAYNNLADALFKEGNINQALSMSKKAVELNPNDVTNLNNLAAIYFNLKQYDQAAVFYDQLTKLVPNDPQGFMDLADTYLVAGKYPEAAVNYRKVLNRLPDNEYAKKQLLMIDEEKMKGK